MTTNTLFSSSFYTYAHPSFKYAKSFEPQMTQISQNNAGSSVQSVDNKVYGFI